MKKLFLMLAFLAIGFSTSAQGAFSYGANIGIPVADASNVASFSFGADATYLYNYKEKWDLGFASNLQFYTGKNGLDGVTNLSLAGASRYDASGKIVLGFDLGWAFGISPSGNDGGLYWKPMVGYNLSDKKLLTLSYNAVRKDKITIANIGFGIMFNM